MSSSVLVSLGHVLELTLDRDHQYLILDEKKQLESLLEKVSFLQDFLDNSSQKRSKTIYNLWGQIKIAAYKAEDIIESSIASRILEGSTGHSTGFPTFSLELEKVIEEIDTIIKKASEQIHEDKSDVPDVHPGTWLRVSSSKPASNFKGKMVGLDDDVTVIKEQLTRGSLNRQTVSLVGMGGIGKTFLAKTVFDDALIVYHFHVRAWVTVSQTYNVKEILLGLLASILGKQICEDNAEKLEELLYKNLKGKRYLIVIDDIWNTKVWDHVRRCFPNDNNGSRIMMTTRLDNVAGYAESCFSPYHMRFLNANDSWFLFCDNVFGKDYCPSELEQIGKKIVENCQGLPLAVVVIAGFLSKAPRTKHYWGNVVKDLHSIIASDQDYRFSKILTLSFENLPHHLKLCFKYVGNFPEDAQIRVSKLVKIWVAEGFIKPSRDKSLEDMAEEYLLDLVDRNLILVSQRSSQGKIKTCMIHDLLRETRTQEVEREARFPTEGHRPRYIRIHAQGKINFLTQKERCSSLRTILVTGHCYNRLNVENSKLIRVLDDNVGGYYPAGLEEAVNLRFLACCIHQCEKFQFSAYKFRNLQTLIMRGTEVKDEVKDVRIHLEHEFWRMTQLRHLHLGRMNLADPPSSENEVENPVTVLENLQSLLTVVDFRSTEEILKRIPNLRKLGILYNEEKKEWGYYSLENLVLLDKLEKLKCYSFLNHGPSTCFLNDISFPPSLKSLTLHGRFDIPWEHMSVIGLLPNLLVLKLHEFAFIGPDWESNEGEFLQLKYLELNQIRLEHWRADSNHFPNLQHLYFHVCYGLKEIPCAIGEISTLQMIKVHACEDELVSSAKRILEEQKSYGNDVLQVLTWEK